MARGSRCAAPRQAGRRDDAGRRARPVPRRRPGVDLEHELPDGDADPWAQTFDGLAPGAYTVTEADTAGAATTVVQIGDGESAQIVGAQADGVEVVDGATTVVQFVNTYTGASGSTSVPPTTVAPATTAAPVEPQGSTTTVDLGELARTGGRTDGLARVALLLLLAGAGLVAGTRRRAAPGRSHPR